MDLAAIGASSIDMSLAKTQQAVGIAMLKKSMDQQGQQTAAIVEQMAQATPSFGHQIDVRI